MLTAAQQRQVWEGWLSAEIRANYFAELSTRYRQRQKVVTWLTLFASSGAVLALVTRGGLPWWAPAGLALLTVGLSLYTLVQQNERQAWDAADLHVRWLRLATDAEALWSDMYAATAPARLAGLTERSLELSKAGTAFPVHARRLERWQAHVERHHAAHAAAA